MTGQQTHHHRSAIVHTYPLASDRQVHATFNAVLKNSLDRAAVSIETKRANLYKTQSLNYRALLRDLRNANRNTSN